MSRLDRAVLQLLRDNPSGLTVLNMDGLLRDRGVLGWWNVWHALYDRVRRLEERGLVEGAWDHNDLRLRGGRPRRVYRVINFPE
jgi:DNA-binding PadR family transcriptional regulator